MLHVTLESLRAEHACKPRYRILIEGLGGSKFPQDTPISLTQVLDICGIDDALWAFCATLEPCDDIAREIACRAAERVLPIFERSRPADSRPRNAIEAARRFVRGESSSDDLAAARVAARAAAGDDAWAAGESALVAALATHRGIGDSAYVAARVAASAAKMAAGGNAAEDAERAAQRRDLLELLEVEHD